MRDIVDDKRLDPILPERNLDGNVAILPAVLRFQLRSLIDLTGQELINSLEANSFGVLSANLFVVPDVVKPVLKVSTSLASTPEMVPKRDMKAGFVRKGPYRFTALRRCRSSFG